MTVELISKVQRQLRMVALGCLILGIGILLCVGYLVLISWGRWDLSDAESIPRSVYRPLVHGLQIFGFVVIPLLALLFLCAGGRMLQLSRQLSSGSQP